MRLKMAVRMCGAGRGAPPSQPIDRTGIIALIDELDHLISDLKREVAVIDCEIGRLSHQAQAIAAYSRPSTPHARRKNRIGNR
jgi:hypothetical protein